MKPSSKRVMFGSTLRWGAALLLALLVWGPAAADETEKKLSSPGFRPPSGRADAFMKAVGSAPIAVFPTAVRNIGGGTSYDRASQKEIVRLLKDNGLGGGEALERKLDWGKLGGNSQFEAFLTGKDALGKEVAKAKVQSDYALVVELLIHPDQSKEVAVWGIHCYVLERDGTNAFSFLLNSHHKLFVDAALKTQDRSAKGQEKLVAGAVRTALKALKQQVEGVRGDSTSTFNRMKVLERLVGTWQVEQITRVPEETRPTNIVVKGELVLGGRFTQQTGGFDDKGKPTQTAMYTYDSQQKTYRYWFFHASGFFWESTGTWDESSQKFTFTGTLGEGGTGTITVRFSDETTYVFSVINRDASGEITYHLEGKGVRQEMSSRPK
jgi:hypothetical protein